MPAEIAILTASSEPVNLAAVDIPPLAVGVGGTGNEGAGARDKAKAGQGNAAPLFAECAGSPDRAIIADVFKFQPGTDVLPDFSKLRAVKIICLAQLDITTRTISEGFPSLNNPRFLS